VGNALLVFEHRSLGAATDMKKGQPCSYMILPGYGLLSRNANA
jgi:hypothetical protein